MNGCNSELKWINTQKVFIFFINLYKIHQIRYPFAVHSLGAPSEKLVVQPCGDRPKQTLRWYAGLYI